MAKRTIVIDRLRTILRTALAHGATRKNLTTVEWDISGDCENPYLTELWGRPEIPHRDRSIVISRGSGLAPQYLELQTRCRQCPRCLRTRARRWYGSAVHETQISNRTWFGTLTLSPEWQFKFLSICRKKLATQGLDYDALQPRDQFITRHNAIGVELTKYVKRVRKNSGAGLRYLLVAEAHKSGNPHYHMLVHEIPGRGKVTHQNLSTAWHVGFEQWRLVPPEDPRKAGYLCKYLSKSLSARVRASQRYGDATSEMRTYAIDQLEKLIVEKRGPTKF